MDILASLPSPSQSVWMVGPFPLRAYAFAIISGIAVAWWMMTRRYAAKGGPAERVPDMATWMVLAGILGGRIYHVVTDYQLYFGPGKNPWNAFAVWNGGLGIWGAIFLGGVAAWLSSRHYGLRLGPIADSLAPGLLIAQALGRIGNYFNQELYGRPTDMPWGLEIDAQHMVAGYPVGTTFHPTFLYEMIWCLAGACFLLWLDKKYDVQGGQLFACYVMVYTSGRMWIENLRIDSAHQLLGLRLNVWTAGIVFLGGLVAFVVLRRRFKTFEGDHIWLSPPQEKEDSSQLNIHDDVQGDEDGDSPQLSGTDESVIALNQNGLIHD